MSGSYNVVGGSEGVDMAIRKVKSPWFVVRGSASVASRSELWLVIKSDSDSESRLDTNPDFSDPVTYVSW